jgi:glyoxylase-like metal-dependent hydrolase (beta-lactamase superfamily II)
MFKDDWFTVKKLDKFIWGIGEFNHPEEVISYLIVGRKEALLFDTGLGLFSIKKIVEKITKNRVLMINSHSHYDHIGGNKYFTENTIVNKNQDSIKINPFLFKVIKTPGHTPDSICLYEKKLGYLFSGDTLYLGPIYLQMTESNISDYKKSINKLLRLNIKKIFAAHNEFYFPVSYLKEIKDTLSKVKNIGSIKKLKIKKNLSLLFKD